MILPFLPLHQATHLLSPWLAVEDTLAVQLEAVAAVVHALEDGRGRLADHGDAVSLFPLPALQALDLQELPGDTQTPDKAVAPQKIPTLATPSIP